MSTITTKRAPESRRRTASKRINLRVDSGTKAMLQRAAGLEQLKLTEFMLKASEAAAQAALAERTRFVLPPEKWRKFNAVLDAPARELPALRRLLTTGSVFKAE